MSKNRDKAQKTSLLRLKNLINQNCLNYQSKIKLKTIKTMKA